MLKWYYEMSLRKKFFVIFGFIIAASVVGITAGQIAYMRAQVGGRYFLGI